MLKKYFRISIQDELKLAAEKHLRFSDLLN